MNEKLELTFDKLKEEELEEVAKLYDAERPITTNRVKMKQTFAKNKNNIGANQFYKELGYKCENGYVKFLGTK